MVVAVDYGKVDRTIKKEPDYQSEKPTYALLLFGRDLAVRVWIVLDGKTVYVDRNADGDLTGKDERFAKLNDCRDITIRDEKGKPRYKITSMSAHPVEKPPGVSLMVDLDVTGDTKFRQYCDAAMDADPCKAAIAHFDGPLTAGPVTILWKVPQTVALAVGDEPTDLRAVVGTMNAKYRCWVVVRSHNGDKYAFPKGVTPVVDIEFPAKTPKGPRVKKRYSLTQFC